MRLYDILKDLYAFPTGSQQPYDNLIWVFLMWAWLIIVSWVLDIASLLKKKSPRETMAVMALRGVCCRHFIRYTPGGHIGQENAPERAAGFSGEGDLPGNAGDGACVSGPVADRREDARPEE